MIYISGAITGTSDYKVRFLDAENKLAIGYYGAIINPVRVCGQLPLLKHDEYMTVCFAMLSLCDEIYMLRGWETSKGARMEHDYAKGHNIKIIYESEESVGD